jgi:hypothetical protein
MNKSEILQLWYDEVWTKGNLKAIDELLGEETEAQGIIPSLGIQRQDYADLVIAIRALLGPIKVTLSQTLEEGDWLAARYLADTENPGTGEPVQVSGQVMARFSKGQIVESYYLFDFFSLFQQLGQLPPDSLPVCLTGQRLDWA